MEIKLANDLRMDIEVPMLNVECFRLVWKPNDHALLKIEGYVNRNIEYRLEQIYGSSVQIWQERDNKKQVVFHGFIVGADKKTVGKTERISLKAMSGSWKLDQHPSSRSFQAAEMTYSEIARQVTNGGGGQVICTLGADRQIGRPVIQYEETIWEFLKRLASHLEAYVVPDVGTGKPNLWFGMRKGEVVPAFSEEEYVIRICRSSRRGVDDISYEVESKEYYKLGDRTTFLGQKVFISELTASYEYSNLVFSYLLKEKGLSNIIYQSKFAGLGLKGTIREVKNELVKVALDIDHRKSTGNYFYHWYPETGNALYAMPEIDAKTMLYFSSVDEREAFAIHCLPKEAEEELTYKERCFDIENGNSVKLFQETLSFSRGEKHNLSLSNSSISIGTSKELSIYAEEKIKLKAKCIMINTPDELIIHQG